MKKTVIIFLCFWAFILSTTAQYQSIRYEIRFDSQKSNIQEIKAQVIAQYLALTEYVDDSSHGHFVAEALDTFKVNEETDVQFESNLLSITIGDGKGLFVSGMFQDSCKVEIKKTSLLGKWMQGIK